MWVSNGTPCGSTELNTIGRVGLVRQNHLAPASVECVGAGRSHPDAQHRVTLGQEVSERRAGPLHLGPPVLGRRKGEALIAPGLASSDELRCAGNVGHARLVLVAVLCELERCRHVECLAVVLKRRDLTHTVGASVAQQADPILDRHFGVTLAQEVRVLRVRQLRLVDGVQCGRQRLAEEVTAVDAHDAVGIRLSDKRRRIVVAATVSISISARWLFGLSGRSWIGFAGESGTRTR